MKGGIAKDVRVGGVDPTVLESGQRRFIPPNAFREILLKILVDLDKQANATYTFDIAKPKFVFVDIVLNRCGVTDSIVPIGQFLDFVPSSLDNARLEIELSSLKKNQRMFYRNLFVPVRDNYDVVIFDLPPDLSHNTYLSSLFADTICIPTTADEYGVYGMKLTLSSLEGIQLEYPDLKQEVNIIWSKFDSREKSGHHYITSTQDIGVAHIMPVVIRSDVTFKHAQTKGKSVFQLSRRSNAKEDIDILAQELIGLREFLAPKGTA
ncbi:MAG: ParA family protein [Deltaproteobacteria bacterium]|nr:ParA family protein [Deltaproteobacteria bacterium]